MNSKWIIFYVLIFLGANLTAQNVIVNGYVFESGNRGYLNQVSVDIVNKNTGESVVSTQSNEQGYFEVEIPANSNYVAYAQKQLFYKKDFEFDTKDIQAGSKKFLKIQLEREPGYDFEVTLAPKRDNENIPVDAIRGAWIEVYNNTTKEEILNLKDNPELEFNVHFEKGNHYTVMIRKEGFFTKRMEAYVNVEGCILCFEGVGNIRPGVVDNLTEGNEMGVLLANVELEPLFSGKTFEIENIYYDFNKANLRPEAKTALKSLSTVLNDNKHIMVELGSHTDSRGKKEDNQILSEERAKSAVDYLVNYCDVDRSSIIAAGYGESNLTNNCKDGVDCTEEQHQKNRRTEIKVLNISNNKKVQKTLAEIRVEEEFLKSVMNDELEVKVEEVEAYNIEKEPEIEIVNKPKDSVKNMDEFVKSKTNSNPDLPTIDPKQGSSISEESKKQSENAVGFGSASNQTANYNDYYLRNKKNMGDYTGYKIVIQFSKEPLSKDHEIYSKHNDITEFYTLRSVLYMIGDFEEKNSADIFLKKIKSVYEGAYIVQFQDGKRIK